MGDGRGESPAFTPRQIEDAAFAVHRALVRATVAPRESLVEADCRLAVLRTSLRLARELHFFGINQYEHAARLVDELGRRVGGWQRRAGVTVAPTAPRGRDVGVGERPSWRVLEQQHRVPLRERVGPSRPRCRFSTESGDARGKTPRPTPGWRRRQPTRSTAAAGQ